MIWYVACSGDEHNVGTFSRNSDTANGAQERRFVGGSQLIPLRLARQLGDIVALKAPVERIDQRDGHVVVHTGRGAVRAKRVIVAARRRWCSTSTGSRSCPGPPPAAAAPLDMGQLMKCDAVYATPFWRKAGLNGFGINDHGAAALLRQLPAGRRAASCWRSSAGRPGERTACCRSQRRQAVLEGFAAMFGEQALHPIDYVEHDWTKERWTGGGPTAIHAPGTLVEFGPADP